MSNDYFEEDAIDLEEALASSERFYVLRTPAGISVALHPNPDEGHQLHTQYEIMQTIAYALECGEYVHIGGGR